MKVYIENQNKELELDFEGKVVDLLKHLDISNYNSVFVDVNDILVAHYTKISTDDRVRIFNIITDG